jgi:hypothetical protein
VGQVGILTSPGDLLALCEAVIKLSESPQRRARLGQKGHAFARRKWDKQQVLADFELRLRELVSIKRSCSRQFEHE